MQHIVEVHANTVIKYPISEYEARVLQRLSELKQIEQLIALEGQVVTVTDFRVL